MTPNTDLSKLVIRNLKEDDLDRVIHIDSLTTGYPRNPYFERKFRRIFGEDSQLLLSLVAEMEGRVIGYIMGEANTCEYGIPEPVASVDTLGVDTAYKRLGVGSILLEEYCGMAIKAGVELMTTLISQDYPEIVEFFKSQNFQPAEMVALERKLKPEGNLDW